MCVSFSLTQSVDVSVPTIQYKPVAALEAIFIKVATLSSNTDAETLRSDLINSEGNEILVIRYFSQDRLNFNLIFIYFITFLHHLERA